MKEDFEAEKKKYFSPIRFGKTKKIAYFYTNYAPKRGNVNYEQTKNKI